MARVQLPDEPATDDPLAPGSERGATVRDALTLAALVLAWIALMLLIAHR